MVFIVGVGLWVCEGVPSSALNNSRCGTIVCEIVSCNGIHSGCGAMGMGRSVMCCMYNVPSSALNNSGCGTEIVSCATCTKLSTKRHEFSGVLVYF